MNTTVTAGADGAGPATSVLRTACIATDAVAALRDHGLRLLSEAEWEWIWRPKGNKDAAGLAVQSATEG